MLMLAPHRKFAVNSDHILRAHIARNRAPEPVAPWQVNLKMADGWVTWSTHQTEQEAVTELLLLIGPDRAGEPTP